MHWLLLLGASLLKFFFAECNTFDFARIFFFVSCLFVLTLVNSFASYWSGLLSFKDIFLNQFCVKTSSALWHLTFRRFHFFSKGSLPVNKIANISFDHSGLRKSLIFFLSCNMSCNRIVVLLEEPLKQFKDSSDFTMREIDNLWVWWKILHP